MKVVKPLRLNVRPRPASRQGPYPLRFSVLAPTTTEVAPRLHSALAQCHYAADGIHTPTFATLCTERVVQHHPLPQRQHANPPHTTKTHRNMPANVVGDRRWRRALPAPAVCPALMSLHWCPTGGCLRANDTSPKALTHGNADRQPDKQPLRFRPPGAPH